MIKKEKNMNNIKLESVGTAVDENGMTHPINADGTLDMYDGMSGHIMDCDDEWWTNMSCEDAVKLFPFLAETDVYDIEGYLIWALAKGELVEEANGMLLSEVI